MKPTSPVAATTTRLHPSGTWARGEMVDIGSASVRLMVRGPDTQGGFSLIEYTIPPRTLVAPLHRHTWEDEHSFVLDGRIAVVLGEDIIYLAAGELAVKPRRLWHTVWNPGDTPARVLEVISPGGFEHFFEELAEALHAGDTDCLAPGELGRRYGLDTDYESVAQLCAEHRLRFPQRATGEDA